MSKILDDVSYLSRTIGPRPAGTEEEQRAALYIADAIQQDSGLSCTIEDFKCPSVNKLPEMICFGASFVVALLAFFIPFLILPALIISLISCALLGAELLDKPILSRVFDRGVSQNVIAKYEPGFTEGNRPKRRRKIVVVAHYDSGKSTPKLLGKLQGVRTPLAWICLASLALLPILLLIRFALGVASANPFVLVVNILLLVALILCLVPLVIIALEKQSAYNEAANCNASGVAVLMELARRIGAGQVSAAEFAQEGNTTIHGAEEAHAQGLIPEGASLQYETAVSEPEFAPLSEAERLASAKAAIAALTGKPVKGAAAAPLPENLVQAEHEPLPQYSSQAQTVQNQEIKQVLSGTAQEEAQAEQLSEEEEAQKKISEAALSAEEKLHEKSQEFESKDLASAESDQVNTAHSDAVQPEKLSATVVAASLSAAGSVLKEAASQIPEWYKKAQAKVHKEKAPVAESQRSRFAEAFDKAEQEIKERSEEAVLQDARISALQESIKSAGLQQDNTASLEDSEVEPKSEADTVQEPAQSVENANTASDHKMVDQQESVEPKPASAVQEPAAAQDEGATCALDPIDVSSLQEELRSGEAQMPSDPSFIAQVNEETAEYRKPVVLPDLPAGTAPLPSLGDLQQRAPLALAADEGGKSAAKSLLATTLPALEEDKPAQQPHVDPMTLPSLSGTITAEPLTPASPISSTGSFAAVQATGSFAPVGEELLADVDPEDLYIEDADDSEYSENFTETGAFAGPGYVEMPKGKIRSFFDRFSRKKKQQTEDFEQSTQEWLDVDEDFEARSVGAARGGWESFRVEDDEFELQEQESEQVNDPAQTQVIKQNTEDFEALQQTSPQPLPAFARRKKVERIDTAFVDQNWEQEDKNWNGGAYQAENSEQETLASEENIEERFKQIYQFKHPDLDTEVWLVALGSELSGQAGVKAFVNEHRAELKGALVINLEAMGAGKLTYIEKEGMTRPVTVSSRMKRYIRKATQATGTEVATGQLIGFDSPASYAMTRGLPAMSLVGVQDPQPAYSGQAEDIIERIDEEKLLVNTDFVMELLKNI